MEMFYVDARGRAYRVPQQHLLAASVADLEFALAGIQPLPSLQVNMSRMLTLLQSVHKPVHSIGGALAETVNPHTCMCELTRLLASLIVHGI